MQGPARRPDAPPPGGTVGAVANLVQASGRHVAARLRLAHYELSEASSSAGRALAFATIAALFLFVPGYLFTLVGGVALIARATEIDWTWVALATGILHLVLGGVLMVFALRHLRSITPLESSLALLDRDTQWISQRPPPKNP